LACKYEAIRFYFGNWRLRFRGNRHDTPATKQHRGDAVVAAALLLRYGGWLWTQSRFYSYLSSVWF